LISALNIGCNTKESYNYGSEQGTIEFLKNNRINFFNLTFTDEFGSLIYDSFRQILNTGRVVRHFYRSNEEK